MYSSCGEQDWKLNQSNSICSSISRTAGTQDVGPPGWRVFLSKHRFPPKFSDTLPAVRSSTFTRGAQSSARCRSIMRTENLLWDTAGTGNENCCQCWIDSILFSIEMNSRDVPRRSSPQGRKRIPTHLITTRSACQPLRDPRSI